MPSDRELEDYFVAATTSADEIEQTVRGDLEAVRAQQETQGWLLPKKRVMFMCTDVSVDDVFIYLCLYQWMTMTVHTTRRCDQRLCYVSIRFLTSAELRLGRESFDEIKGHCWFNCLQWVRVPTSPSCKYAN